MRFAIIAATLFSATLVYAAPTPIDPVGGAGEIVKSVADGASGVSNGFGDGIATGVNGVAKGTGDGLAVGAEEVGDGFATGFAEGGKAVENAIRALEDRDGADPLGGVGQTVKAVADGASINSNGIGNGVAVGAEGVATGTGEGLAVGAEQVGDGFAKGFKEAGEGVQKATGA